MSTAEDDARLLGLLSSAAEGYRDAPVVSAAPLTRAMLRAAMDRMRDEPRQVCSHVVHPLDYKRGGLVPCGNCGGWVYLDEPVPKMLRDGRLSP